LHRGEKRAADRCDLGEIGCDATKAGYRGVNMSESDGTATDLTVLVRRVLEFEMTIAEWIGTALMLAAPYVLVGLVWALTHPADRVAAHGIGWILLFLRAVIAWPVLLLSNACFS